MCTVICQHCTGGQHTYQNQNTSQRHRSRQEPTTRCVWRRHPPWSPSFRGGCVIPCLGCGEDHDGRSNCSARRFLRKYPVRVGRKWTRSQYTTECRFVFLTNGRTNPQRELQLLGLECVEKPKETLQIAPHVSSFKHCVHHGRSQAPKHVMDPATFRNARMATTGYLS